MALKTAGTELDSSLSAIQWQPAGMNQTDLASLMALIRNPVVGAYGSLTATGKAYVENGIFYFPNGPLENQFQLTPGDWICVDANTGWPVVIPDVVFAGTVWDHN